MDSQPGKGLLPLILAKLVCCGGLVLVLLGGGALSGIGTWLLDEGLVWLVAAIAASAVGLLLWRRQRRAQAALRQAGVPESGPRRSKPA